MAKHREKFTEKTIEKRIKEGRGFGVGHNYLPWVTVRDVPSTGICTEISGWKTESRVHQLLSDLETRYLYKLEFNSNIVDIREQFPLLDEEKSIIETIKIAKSIGIEHPKINATGTYNVLSTDFLITLNINGKKELKARTLKYSKDLTNKRVIEKFEIERIFWENRGVNWKIVTEKDINRIYSFNVELIHNAYFLKGSNFDFKKILYVENALRNEIENNPQPLANLTQNIDITLGLFPGDSLFCVKYLIAHKYWIIDMNKRINTDKLLEVKEFKYLNKAEKEVI